MNNQIASSDRKRVCRAVVATFLHRAWGLIQQAAVTCVGQQFKDLTDTSAPNDQTNFDKFMNEHYTLMWDYFADEVDEIDTESEMDTGTKRDEKREESCIEEIL